MTKPHHYSGGIFDSIHFVTYVSSLRLFFFLTLVFLKIIQNHFIHLLSEISLEEKSGCRGMHCSGQQCKAWTQTQTTEEREMLP